MAVSKPEVADVRLVFTTTLADASVQAAIDDAALMAAGCPVVETYDEDRQKAIVKWMAAHLLSSRSDQAGALTSKKIGDASESYAKASMGTQLSGSSYGQQALLLDPSGCLKRLGNVKLTFKAM